MTREFVSNELIDVCNRYNIDIKPFHILSKKELIDAGGEDNVDPLWGDDYEFVIIYNNHPDYFVTSDVAKNDLGPVQEQMKYWVHELGLIYEL
jgi:hypothetical protein